MGKFGNVKVGVLNTVGVIHIKIINGVRLFSETGHAIKWDVVVNTAMNHLYCSIHCFGRFMNNEVLHGDCRLHNYSLHIQVYHRDSQHKRIVNCLYEIIFGKLAYL
jgi:hypothetical protein